MDEPLSNLDAKLRVQMRSEISAVVRSLNTTTLYVTHDQTEAMTMGDRMAVMKAGELQQLGTPGECYDTPRNIFVAQFVGSPPMNLVLAKVVEIADRARQLQMLGGSPSRSRTRCSPSGPALRSYVGKDVAVGVRSEDMEDGSLSTAPADRRIKGKVALTEALGSQIIVHFTFPGRPVVTEDTKLLAKESGTAEQIALTPDTRREVGRVVRTALQGQDGRRDRDRGRHRARPLLRSGDLGGHPGLTRPITDPGLPSMISFPSSTVDGGPSDGPVATA